MKPNAKDTQVINLKNKFFLSLILILAIFLVDRITKILMINYSELNYLNVIYISSFLNLNLIWNEGIAFGLLSNNSDFYYNLISAMITVLIIFVFILSLKTRGIKNFAYLFIFSGGLGNLYDRIFYKRVPDFIDFHYGDFHWFTFNLADIFITIGIIAFLLRDFLLKKDK